MSVETPKILISTKYENFRLVGHNRELHNTEKLEKSMKTHGFLPSSAIHVKKTNAPGVFEIVRGHHRFTVAKKLNIPFYYIVDESCVDLVTLETIPKTQWSPADFVDLYANTGNTNYVFLRDFAREHEITVMCAAGILCGCVNTLGYRIDGSNSCAAATDLRHGKFVPTRAGIEFAERVMSVSDVFLARGYGRARTTQFVVALAELIRTSESYPQFKLEWLKKNAVYYEKLKDVKSNKRDILLALEEMYNVGIKENKHISFKHMKTVWLDRKALIAENNRANTRVNP